MSLHKDIFFRNIPAKLNSVVLFLKLINQVILGADIVGAIVKIFPFRPFPTKLTYLFNVEFYGISFNHGLTTIIFNT